MSAEIIPFDFEEQAVRVVMRDGEPWFVAADVCRVLEIQNPTQAVQRLDEDEVTLCQTEGNHRPTNLISESGLYALVIRSDKAAAKRFRKWITAEVIPSIRRTGRYDHPSLPDRSGEGEVAGLPLREAELWLQMVREARLTRGTRAAASIWDRSPLPPLQPLRLAEPADPVEGRACLAHVLAFDIQGQTVGETSVAALAGDMGAFRALAMFGLRTRPEGLFIASGGIAGLATLFSGSRWEAGRHKAALLAVPGAAPAGPYTLMGVQARGVVVPCDLGADHV